MIPIWGIDLLTCCRGTVWLQGSVFPLSPAIYLHSLMFSKELSRVLDERRNMQHKHILPSTHIMAVAHLGRGGGRKHLETGPLTIAIVPFCSVPLPELQKAPK